jgi:trigger factor
MKAEFTDVNETLKSLKVEIPTDTVNAEIDRLARDYSRRARVPGFRPGKAPARVIKQRYKSEILHDLAHDLIPRAVDNALRERGMEAIEAPDIRDVNVEENQPLTFTASFETVPPFDTGDYAGLSLTRPDTAVPDDSVDHALQRLRDRAARYEPIESRGVEHGDTVTVDLERKDAAGQADSHKDVAIEIGGKANPPGLDEQLLGLTVGAVKTFTLHYPADYAVGELANQDVGYTVTVKSLKRRVRPELDDEFAKDLGDFENLAALRARVREDLEHEATHAGERDVRAALMKQLATRVPFPLPAPLVERELDRRLEDFARRMMEQGIDPRQAGVDWQAFRESQRDAAVEAAGGAVYLDQLARHEQIDVSAEEIDQEVGRYAERTGRTPAAVRAALDKEQGLSRVASGIRREKSIEFLLSRATMSGAGPVVE